MAECPHHCQVWSIPPVATLPLHPTEGDERKERLKKKKKKGRRQKSRKRRKHIFQMMQERNILL